MAEGLPKAVDTLDEREREVLAALAVMGDSTLVPQQVATLLGVADVRPTLAELDRRGLLRHDDDRVGAAPGLRERLAHAWDLAETGDRVLKQLISIAADGRLTLGDLDAVLGISQWACEVARFEELLRLVRLVQTGVDVYRRVEDWITILRRAQTAARELGDGDAEAWVEEELRRAGLARSQAPTRELRRSRVDSDVPAAAARRVRVWAGRLAALVVTAAAGVGIGLALNGGASSGAPAGTTVTAPARTVTLSGRTVTVSGTTVSLPGTTVTLTGTTLSVPAVTTTVTAFVTTTVTVNAAALR